MSKQKLPAPFLLVGIQKFMSVWSQPSGVFHSLQILCIYETGTKTTKLACDVVAADSNACSLRRVSLHGFHSVARITGQYSQQEDNFH